jgi:hypothetical protein
MDLAKLLDRIRRLPAAKEGSAGTRTTPRRSSDYVLNVEQQRIRIL